MFLNDSPKLLAFKKIGPTRWHIRWRYLPWKPCDPSSSPQTHIRWKEKGDSPKLSFNLYTHTISTMPTQIHMHTYNSNNLTLKILLTFIHCLFLHLEFTYGWSNGQITQSQTYIHTHTLLEFTWFYLNIQWIWDNSIFLRHSKLLSINLIYPFIYSHSSTWYSIVFIIFSVMILNN